MDALAPPTARLSESDACSLAHDLYGVTAVATPLPSERDQNFLLEIDGRPRFVLKIAGPSDSRAVLEAQNAVLAHVANCDPGLRCPRLQRTVKGEGVGTVELPGGARGFVRLLSYLPGHLLVDVRPHTPALLESVGRFFGRLDRALEGFSHPAFRRELLWDLRHAGRVIEQNLPHVEGREHRAFLEGALRRFTDSIEPRLPELRTSVIHNDGNDYNVLVKDLDADGGTAAGVVDFGDMVESCTVFEPAVCAAYAMLGKPDPVGAAAAVVAG